ncbi:ankyrin repeat, SAM and basic leucine zipper domain-containing protein 1 [Parasteatoda tepidariorum]|uniref:ankyrin repeat, SAM and basic leucine zipper domain-containing protein 1 n=1 Tax=Parasteatoda tepidariorum TaxID=114398 RepID=UPI0039BC9216
MKRIAVAAGMESDDDDEIDDIVFPSSESTGNTHSQDIFVSAEQNVKSPIQPSPNLVNEGQYVANGAPGSFSNPSVRQKVSYQRGSPRGVSYQIAKSRGYFNQRPNSASSDPSSSNYRYQSHKSPSHHRQHPSTVSSEKLDDLRYAITTGNLETTKDILSKGIWIDTILKAGWTGLMYACSSGHSNIVSYFLENKADPNYHKDMYTPLMAVCASRKTEQDLLKCCILLLQYGANVNEHERHLTTPLMFAAREGYISIVKELLNHGAEVNSQDNSGKTALLWAASYGHGQIIRLLLQNNADKNICDNMGQTPEDIAYGNGYKELVSLIQKGPIGLTVLDAEESLDEITKTTNKSIEATMIVSKPKNFSKVGELELFLSGIGCSTLVKKFQEHDLNFHDMLVMNEEELEKIGIAQVGVRKKILEACKSVHKKEWEHSSLPNLKQKQYISCPDAVAMMANVSAHLKFIATSVKYVRQQIQSQPRILELAQDSANVFDLIDELKDGLKNVHFLNEEIRFLKLHLERVQGQVEYIPADLIVETVPTPSSQRKVLFISLSVAVTTFIGIFAGILWKNPSSLSSIPIKLKLPFLK